MWSVSVPDMTEASSGGYISLLQASQVSSLRTIAGSLWFFGFKLFGLMYFSIELSVYLNLYRYIYEQSIQAALQTGQKNIHLSFYVSVHYCIFSTAWLCFCFFPPF